MRIALYSNTLNIHMVLNELCFHMEEEEEEEEEDEHGLSHFLVDVNLRMICEYEEHVNR